TCWSFSTTSFLESECFRLTGQKIKLSEMYTVYFEYLEKVRRFVRERGQSAFGQGSEAEGVLRMWKQYGCVPREIYPGVLREDGRFDHTELFQRLRAYLDWVEEKELWDEDLVLASVRLILNETLGEPPRQFEWNGKTYTPATFRDQVVGLNLDDYVAVMSTLKYPFYTWDEYAVPDNWWHSKKYYNVPLDDFYAILKGAVKAGYSVFFGGDVSEPGIEGLEDAAIIPEWDIPAKYINQEAREFRIYNHTTTDDHGIHMVGYTRKGRHDWFLIKDSGSGAWRGKYDGYFFYRDDYVKLKMRTILVHKDAVLKVLPDFSFQP
ncbi:MAG: peptidase C1, partial [Candidatus Neomarinimicrobiota bacterium]